MNAMKRVGIEASMFLALLALAFSLASADTKAPNLPKPTPNCQGCRNATLADVKE